jgi:hypothetical protein
VQTKLIACIVTIIVFSLYGCAERGQLFPNFKAGQPILNLYNRNFIVSMPTQVGNVACVLPFLPFGLISIQPPSIVEYAANTLITTCGAITGISFVPLSFICPENPWYGEGKGEYHEWRCAKPIGGPFLLNTKPEKIIDSKIEMQR